MDRVDDLTVLDHGILDFVFHNDNRSHGAADELCGGFFVELRWRNFSEHGHVRTSGEDYLQTKLQWL